MDSTNSENYRVKQKYRILGLNIAYYRKMRGITQSDLAEQLNISREHLAAIEAPNIVRGMSMDVLFNISDALGVEETRLLEMHMLNSREEQ